MKKCLPFLIVSIFTLCLLTVPAFAQDQKEETSQKDTTKIPDPIRSGGYFGPYQFNYISAQDNILGASPEAAKATRYADTPVSYAYGLAEIGIPIYTVQSRQLSLPITLIYDSSGIKPEEISGIVGLGWSLQAGGVITREIVSMVDGTAIPSEFTDPATAEYLSNLAASDFNTDYDRYHYSFCGHTGSFYYFPNGTILPLEPTEFVIAETSEGIVFTDKDGTKYIFAQNETSSRYMGSTDPNAPLINNSAAYYNTSTVTAKYLTEIRSMDGTDHIYIEYTQLDEFSNVRHSYYRYVSFPYRYLGNGTWQTNLSGGNDPTPAFQTLEWSFNTTNTWHPYVVSSISFNGGLVSFGYNSFSPVGVNNTNRRSYPSFLSSITVTDTTGTSTFFSWSFTNDVTGDKRSLLSQVSKKGSDGATIESWTMDYDSKNTDMGENSVDLFGYYNGANNTSKAFLRPYNDMSTVNFQAADRYHDSTKVRRLSLKSITTASGSLTRYKYNSNEIATGGNSNLFSSSIQIGQRIASIRTYDLSGGTEKLIRTRTFTYADPGITIPIYAFQMGAFISTTEYNTVVGGIGVGSWYGPTSPVRVGTVVYNDQSNLPGAPLESARIFYQTVTEDISDGSFLLIRTKWEYDGTDAVSTGSGTIWVPSDTHDTQCTTPYANHFHQRVPTYIPRNGSQSNPTTPLGYHFQEQNRPQLANPIRVTSYKMQSLYGQIVPTSVTEYTYESTYDSFQTGLHLYLKTSPNTNGYESLTTHCLEDVDQQQVDCKVYYQRLKQRLDKEYLDDGTIKQKVTQYQYAFSPTGRTSFFSGNTYSLGTIQFPSMGAILSPRREISMFGDSAPRAYYRTVIYPDELVGVSGCSWASSLIAAGYRSPVAEELAVANYGSAMLSREGRYVTWGNVPVSSWSGGSGSNTLLKPSRIDVYRNGTNVGPSITYTTYDSYGNPLGIQEDGKPDRTYVWGYNQSYPIAEVAGSVFSATQSGLSTTQKNQVQAIATSSTFTTGQNSQYSTLQSILRNTFPLAHTSLFTYGQLARLLSEEDASGKITQYEYDAAGRLAIIKDGQNNAQQQYAYSLASGSSGMPNRIEATTFTQTGSVTSYSFKDVSFFDGLGRNIQNIAVGAATSGRDLVTPLNPDFLDNEDHWVYLPYPGSTSVASGSYRSNAITEQQSHYGSGIKAYTLNIYEISTRNRVLSTSLPGFTETTAFSTAGAAANTVLKLSYNASGNTISASGYYAAGTFTVSITTGPDGSRSESYADEFGTPVLERVKLDASGTYADTYYIKDPIGRIVCVVPPAEAAQLTSSTSGYSATNCYTYAYDARDRITQRQLPGCAAELFSYNQAGLPVTRTTVANDGATTEVFTTEYDAFFRPTKDKYAYGTNTAVTLAEYYYDSYPSGVIGFVAESGYSSTASSKICGLKTAEQIHVLPPGVAPSSLSASNTSSYVFRAFYYDDKGNVIQTAETDGDGTTCRTSSQFGFAGNLLKQFQRIIPGTGQTAQTMERAYTYDARLRSTAVTAQLGSGSQASMSYTYDNLQRMASVSRGSGTESSQYSYTLQGWLSSAISTSWEETLRYQSPSRTATDGLPGKAGLITEWTVQQKGTGGTSTSDTYAFSYDKAGRFTGSLRYAGTATTGSNLLTERNITYDRSGNLLTLSRYGSSSATTPIESLSFSYSGPKRSGWSYDPHGNVTSDMQNGLSVAWNVINLPRTISTSTASTQRTYLADGTLAQISDGSTTRLYLGDMVFNKASNGTITLESAAWDGGRLLPGTGNDKVLYYVNDHLGSTRVVKDGSGTVRQRYDYYPYGTVSNAWTSSSTTDNSEKRYRFGGKEVTGAALSPLSAGSDAYLDFGARLYSPRSAVWLSLDPMAEEYYPFTPYNYTLSNPILYVDPSGRSTLVKRIDEGTYEVVEVIPEDGKYEIIVAIPGADGKWIPTEEIIGVTPSLYSFMAGDNKTQMIGAIISLTDNSGIQFFNEMSNNLRPLGLYMFNAQNNHKYDFKATNGESCVEYSEQISFYRGMPLSFKRNGQTVYATARDVGNIVAGYYTAAYGITWDEARKAFDIYNKGKEPFVTQGAQLFGYRLGTRLPYSDRIRRRNLNIGIISISNAFIQ